MEFNLYSKEILDICTSEQLTGRSCSPLYGTQPTSWALNVHLFKRATHASKLICSRCYSIRCVPTMDLLNGVHNGNCRIVPSREPRRETSNSVPLYRVTNLLKFLFPTPFSHNTIVPPPSQFAGQSTILQDERVSFQCYSITPNPAASVLPS